MCFGLISYTSFLAELEIRPQLVQVRHTSLLRLHTADSIRILGRAVVRERASTVVEPIHRILARRLLALAHKLLTTPNRCA